jgi:hypothetical protein
MNSTAGDRTERPEDYLQTPAASWEFGVDVAVAEDDA